MIIRYEGALSAVMPAMKEAMHATDATVPLTDVLPLSEVLAADTVEQRHDMLLLAVFSSLALAIAAVGVHATGSCTVAGRLRETGLRRAVGARGTDVISLIIRRGMALVATGAIIGIGVALIAARAIESLLFGITPSDPVTFIVVAAVLLGSALVACLVPALRAARADPLSVLRPGQ